MPSTEENKLSFSAVMHFFNGTCATKKSGCREEKSLPESLWTSQPHADENTCARLVSKCVLAVAAVQVESLGLCSAHAETSPRCLQNWPEKPGAGSLQLQAKQKTQRSFGWLQGQHLVCGGGWGPCRASLGCFRGSKAFQAPLKLHICFAQWGKIPAVVFETCAVNAAHTQLTR